MNKYYEFLTATGELSYVLNNNISKEDLKVLNAMFIERYPNGRLDIIEFWGRAEEYKEALRNKKRKVLKNKVGKYYVKKGRCKK